jgi:hypothetical protein
VKVDVLPGLTDLLPDAATVPIPPSIDTEFAFDTDQLRVVALPAAIEVGEAVNHAIIGAPGQAVAEGNGVGVGIGIGVDVAETKIGAVGVAVGTPVGTTVGTTRAVGIDVGLSTGAIVERTVNVGLETVTGTSLGIGSVASTTFVCSLRTREFIAELDRTKIYPTTIKSNMTTPSVITVPPAIPQSHGATPTDFSLPRYA